MYKPYEEILNRKPDFRVTYHIFPPEESSRYYFPFQGTRWDFSYEHPDHPKNWGRFMIWPEFEDYNGNLITETNITISEFGMARMWIVVEDKVDYHKGKLIIGTLGYFMEGTNKVGECEVIELINLK